MPLEGKLVAVETDFHRDSVKPGGVSRANALLAAGKILKSSQPKIEERVNGAFDAMNSLSSDPAGLERNGALGELAHHVAQLRDYAALANFPIISALAAPFFTLVLAMQQGVIGLRPDALLCFADALRHARATQYRDRPLTDVAELVVILKALESSLLPEHMRSIW